MILISLRYNPTPGNPASFKAFKESSKVPLGYPKGPE